LGRALSDQALLAGEIPVGVLTAHLEIDVGFWGSGSRASAKEFHPVGAQRTQK